MVGPVFFQEMILGARRGKWHWIRWIYAGWLVLQLSIWLFFYMVFAGQAARRFPNLSDLAEFSREYYVPTFTIQHFLLLALMTPILAAGAITDEKSRGTLQYLLCADLLPGEILIGKLIARVYQAFLLGLIGMPLLFFIGQFSGLGLVKAFGFVFCTLLLLFALGSMSMLASVWCRHTRDAVLSVYSFIAVGLLAWQGIQQVLTQSTMPAYLQTAGHSLNPLVPLGQYWLSLSFEEYIQRLLYFTVFWGGFGLACLLIAVWRLRAAYVRQLEKSGKKRLFRWLHLKRPAIGNSPLSWKERFVEGVAPISILRQIPSWLGIIVIIVLTTAACVGIFVENLPIGKTTDDVWSLILSGDLPGLMALRADLAPCDPYFYSFGWVVILLTVFVIGIRCSGAVTGEREKKTWEALLLTPLETTKLIRGKMWGIAGACVPYLVAYAVPALFLSFWCGWGAFFWTVLWLAVTALGIFYAGSTGIWCSVRSQGSWRSLMGTMAFIYGGGFCLVAALSFLAFFVAIFILLILAAIDGLAQRYMGLQTGLASGAAAYLQSFRIALNILMAVSFALISWLLLRNAEYRVGILERTKHWRDEPRYGYRRRRKRRRYAHEYEYR